MAIRITRAGVALTVGIILVAGLIVGGLFLVKHQGEQARREEAVKIAEQNLEQQSNEDVALNEADNEAETNESTQNEESSEATTENSAETGTESTTESPSNEAAVEELPATGTVLDAGAFAILGLLAFSAISYYQSRRALLNL